MLKKGNEHPYELKGNFIGDGHTHEKTDIKKVEIHNLTIESMMKIPKKFPSNLTGDYLDLS